MSYRLTSRIRIRRSAKVIVILFASVFLLIKCGEISNKKEGEKESVEFADFAGSQKCATCHKDIYATHIQTEHFLSTAPATEENIAGSFEEGKNKLVYDDMAYVKMEKTDTGLFQVEYIYDNRERKGRFDITVGSGRKGQSYMSWAGNRLVQLPVTFFTPAGQWSTSPGYPGNKVVYNRPITSRCLECHSTYFHTTSLPDAKADEFDHNEIIYGIDCEKCHGPAAKHVEFQTQHPEEKKGRYIVNPSSLSRQQNLDLCGLCHGGRLSKTKPSFSFQAGDSLANYFKLNDNPMDAISIDVHGNQLGLLSVSKCFELSQMTCNSCHNTHKKEKDQLAVFSQRCTNCHSEGHEKICKLTSAIGPAIQKNCIDCHMPKQASQSIAVNLKGTDTLTPVMMRTHWVKVYPGETEKLRRILNKEHGTQNVEVQFKSNRPIQTKTQASHQ